MDTVISSDLQNNLPNSQQKNLSLPISFFSTFYQEEKKQGYYKSPNYKQRQAKIKPISLMIFWIHALNSIVYIYILLISYLQTIYGSAQDINYHREEVKYKIRIKIGRANESSIQQNHKGLRIGQFDKMQLKDLLVTLNEFPAN
ncbi:hypothetical protein ABPG74_009261 [Tetrahymena malaccensis]